MMNLSVGILLSRMIFFKTTDTYKNLLTNKTLNFLFCAVKHPFNFNNSTQQGYLLYTIEINVLNIIGDTIEIT